MIRASYIGANRRAVAFRGDQGIALVIVLWMLALLTVIANSMVFSLRSEVQAAANLVATARAEAAADAGVNIAMMELARPPTDLQRWQGNGMTHSLHIGDIALRIMIVDEAAKIDINSAPETLLAGLGQSIGMDEVTAVAFADAVVDWRDADELRRLHGAEKDEYSAAEKDYGPRNGNFESIYELRLVFGVNEELFERLAPLVTVNSGLQGIDTTMASQEVLMALPSATKEQVDLYLDQRQQLLGQGLPIPAAPFAQAYSAPRQGNTFSVQVHAVLGDTVSFFREAVVQVTNNPKEPVVILSWRAHRAKRDDLGQDTSGQQLGHHDRK